MRKILVVDDSLTVRESFRMILKDNYHITTLSLGEGPPLLTEAEGIDLVVLGITHPLQEKIEFLQNLIEYNEDIAVLLMADHQMKKEISRFFDYGISDFLLLPLSIYEIKENIQRLLIQKDTKSSLSQTSIGTGKISKYHTIYCSPLVEDRVSVIITKAFHNDAPVLIQGEYGSGHEMIAKAIHYNGLRREGFFKLNCTHLLEESFVNFLLGMEGHGSFKRSSTLFLEDVEAADSHVQMRLMEIIEEQTFIWKKRQVGLNLRIIASTCGDLSEKVNHQEFREDLFYRLNIIPVTLSPLRQRKEDIPLIADYFLEGLCQKMKLKRKTLSSDAAEVLKNYYWPGNLLELESVITRSSILIDKEVISDRELSFGFESDSVVLPSNEVPRTYHEPLLDKENEETLEDISLDILIANLAHEVKNPLVAIKTFTQLLSERFDDDEFRGQFYKIVGENVDKLDSLIKRIMDYTAFLFPHFQKIDVSSVIENALMKNDDQFGEKESFVQRDFQKDLPPVWSDKDQLQFVFDGILSKVLNMMPGGSGLSLSVAVSNSKSEEMNHLPGLECADAKTVEIKIPLSHSKIAAPSLKETSPIMGLELYLAQRLVNKNL
ncbi:MAG: sigma 54-interacting transcriptional regulator, partial [Thermodesulfobacteriota bacterium]|nr:sigma 54-interacting transcriptional regulator [Thermodesulfobacteriota bacterium]